MGVAYDEWGGDGELGGGPYGGEELSGDAYDVIFLWEDVL